MRNVKEAFARRPTKMEAAQLTLADLGECSSCKAMKAEVEALRAENVRLLEALDYARLQEAKKSGKKKEDARKVMERWRLYHRENPKVFNAIVDIVANQHSQGVGHTTIRAIWEGLRTHTWLPGVQSKGEFRLPDHFIPLYVRLVIQWRPEYERLFDRKESCRFEGLDLVAFLKGDDTVLAGVGASERRTYDEIARDGDE